MEDRQTIREAMSQRRLELSREFQECASAQISQYFIETKLFHHSEHIACYMPHQNEVNTHAIIQAIWRANKRCYLPVVSHQKLFFIAYHENDRLHSNQFGILEPNFDPDKMVQADELDLVLLPLIAFDKMGNRLGTGAGYYDRTFENHSPDQPLIGFAYAFQEVDQLSAKPWDIPLAGIITEQGVRDDCLSHRT